MRDRSILVVLAAILLSMIVLIIVLIREPDPSVGFVVDKYEQDGSRYIFLDTDEWVKVNPDDYVGLEIGDFYEGSINEH